MVDLPCTPQIRVASEDTEKRIRRLVCQEHPDSALPRRQEARDSLRDIVGRRKCTTSLRVQRPVTRVKCFHVAYAKAIEPGIRVAAAADVGAGDTHRPGGVGHPRQESRRFPCP